MIYVVIFVALILIWFFVELIKYDSVRLKFLKELQVGDTVLLKKERFVVTHIYPDSDMVVVRNLFNDRVEVTNTSLYPLAEEKFITQKFIEAMFS